MIQGLGKTFILIGGALFLLGVLLLLAGKIPGTGRLPGDLLIERENLRLYIPLGVMVLLSLLLTVLLNLIIRLLR